MIEAVFRKCFVQRSRFACYSSERAMVVCMLWKYALCAFMHEFVGSHNNLLIMGFFKLTSAWPYYLSFSHMGQYWDLYGH